MAAASSKARSTRSKSSSNGVAAGSMTLADAIRFAYKGTLTQVELAEELGVAQNTVSRWSTGDVEPSLDQIAAVEDACGLPRGFVLRAAGYVDASDSAEAAIAADHRLDAARRDLMLATYKVALRQSRQS